MSAPAAPAPAPEGILRRISRWIGVAEQVLGGLLLVGLLGLVLLQVTLRLVPGLFAGVWTGELARLMLVSLTFALAGHVMGRGEQITLEIVDHVLSERQLRLVQGFANLVVCAVSLGLAASAWALLTSGAPQRLPSLGVPVAWTYVIPFAGLLLTALRAALAIVLGRNG